jgi:enoyl-CoA hydratase/carnithine racemase
MPDLLIEKRGHTTIFTLNRPDQMNSLGGTITRDLVAGLADFEADPEQYVAIITGAGDRAFSAGGDLKGMAATAAAGDHMPISHQPDMAGISTSSKITIAAINGLAVAGGLEIAISCDIRIASDQAWFGVFEVKRGLTAGTAVNVLARLIPYGAALDLMLTGDRMSVEDALRIGLIEQIVPHGTVLDAALAKADTICQNSPAALWGTKQVARYWRNLMLTEQHQFYLGVNERVLASGDAAEGTTAFAEKRPPVFHSAWPQTD